MGFRISDDGTRELSQTVATFDKGTALVAQREAEYQTFQQEAAWAQNKGDELARSGFSIDQILSWLKPTLDTRAAKIQALDNEITLAVKTVEGYAPSAFATTGVMVREYNPLDGIDLDPNATAAATKKPPFNPFPIFGLIALIVALNYFRRHVL